jgi:hypothetical protein
MALLSPLVARLVQRCRSFVTSAGFGSGAYAFSGFTAFPPLTTGVLMEAGGFERFPGE